MFNARLTGVKGLVTDENENVVEGAEVMVNSREHTVNTTALGEYWRILVPGTYTITVMVIRPHCKGASSVKFDAKSSLMRRKNRLAPKSSHS